MTNHKAQIAYVADTPKIPLLSYHKDLQILISDIVMNLQEAEHL
jgi:hypothetical protein